MKMNIKIKSGLICILFLSLAVPAFTETTDDIFRRGVEEYRAGNFEAALDDFVLVSLLEPGNKTALKYSEDARKQLFDQRGKQLDNKGGEHRNIAGTGSISVRTATDSKLSAKVEKKLGQASESYSAGDMPQAVDYWKQALEMDPDNIEATRSIAIARAAAKNLEQERRTAVEDIREKTILSDNVKKKLDEASRYYSSGDINMAVKIWNGVLMTSPNCQEAKRSIRIAELSVKRLEDDRKSALADEEKRSQAYVDTEGSKSRDSVVDGKMRDAYQKYSYGDVSQAMSVWKDVLAIQPSNVEAAQRLDAATQIEPIYKNASKSYKKKDWLKANDGFLRILEIDPECPFAKQSIDNIDNELRRIIDNESGSREAFYASGFFYYNQKRYNEAIGEWKKAIALTTGSRIFSLTESEIQDYISRASTYLEKERLANQPPPPKPRPKPKTQAGSAQQQQPQQQQIAVDVEKSNEYYTQGLMLFSEGKINDAIGAWELALRYNPDNHNATRNIAKARKIIGR